MVKNLEKKNKFQINDCSLCLSTSGLPTILQNKVQYSISTLTSFVQLKSLITNKNSAELQIRLNYRLKCRAHRVQDFWTRTPTRTRRIRYFRLKSRPEP